MTYSGVRWDESLPDDADTVEAVERWLRRKWGRMVDGSERVFAFDGLTDDLVRAAAGTLDDLFRRYPKVAERIRAVGSSEALDWPEAHDWTAFASADGRLAFGSNVLRGKTTADLGKILKAKNDEIRSEYRVPMTWSVSDEPMSVLVHEFGHHVGFAAEAVIGHRLARLPLDDIASMYGSTFRVDLIDSYTAMRLQDRIDQIVDASDTYDVARELSMYGATTPREAIAEAFVEYHMSDSPRSFARQLMDYVLSLVGQMPRLVDTVEVRS